MKTINNYILEKLKLNKDIKCTDNIIEVGDHICVIGITENDEQLFLSLTWSHGIFEQILKKSDKGTNVLLRNARFDTTIINGIMFLNKNGFEQINDHDDIIYLIVKPNIALDIVKEILLPITKDYKKCSNKLFNYFDNNHQLFKKYELEDIRSANTPSYLNQQITNIIIMSNNFNSK